MNYQHRFRVRAPIKSVADFHSHSSSLGAITPPPMTVRDIQSPDTLHNDDTMAFTLAFAFVRLRWVAHIENVSPNGFTDRQTQGTFRTWVHRHSYIHVDANAIDVLDNVTAELNVNFPRLFVGLGMWLSLPMLFAYRAWKTKRLLEAK
jgi:ligand-binding SRPBCC domain-containing protein